jgi:Alpha/beta hydrolase family
MRTFLTFILVLIAQGAYAANAQFTFLKTISANELNTVLNEERDTFMKTTKAIEPYAMPKASRAVNDVDLYTVEYDSVVPEQGRRTVRTSGLVALPKIKGSGAVPLISYQHGTVFGKYEVPSYAFKKENPSGFPHYDGAYETRYMVALFAGNGHALMAADYFGMGRDAQGPEAYFVKESTQQANLDLYRDVQTFLKDQNIAISRLFLGGWSQGGLNTTSFLHRLEAEGVQVSAAFTASAPNDPFAALHGLMYFPREGLDAIWLNSMLALTVFAYENYYNQPGLARSVIAPAHYTDLESIYKRSYGAPANLLAIFQKLGNRPLLEYFKEEYKDPAFFANSGYAHLLRRSEAYQQLNKTPLKMYYGSRDEVIKEPIATLASTYQKVLVGNTENDQKMTIQTQRIPGADHRATFVTAAPDALAWIHAIR